MSEDEMIGVYLQTELNSVRFRRDIEAYAQKERIDLHMLHVPDWRNAQENALRRAILGVYRGYGRNEGYFIGFPPGVRWGRGIFTREELEQGRDIDYDYLGELSGGTRMAICGAKNALASKGGFGWGR